MSQIEKMQSRLDDANEQARASYVAKCAAESELFALGVQVQAMKERLKLATDCVDSMRQVRASGMMPDRVARAMDEVFAAFDAVPGDAGVVVDCEARIHNEHGEARAAKSVKVPDPDTLSLIHISEPTRPY